MQAWSDFCAKVEKELVSQANVVDNKQVRGFASLD